MNTGVKRFVITLLAIGLAVGGYYLYSQFATQSEPRRIAQVIHLEDRRELSGKLLAYTKDKSAAVRRRAALAIGRIGGSGASDRLFAMLGDDSVSVAKAAAFGLGLCGSRDDALLLAQKSEELHPDAAAEALVSAGRLGDSTATPLHDYLAGSLTSPDPLIQRASLRGLFLSRANTKGDAVVAMLADEVDPEVILEALYFLGRTRNPSGYAQFVTFLADPDPFKRMLAVRGLGSSDSPEAIHYLSIALNDGDPVVRAQAITELGGKQTAEAVTSLRARVINEDDPTLIIWLVEALERQKNIEAMPALQSLIVGSGSSSVRSAALRAYGTLAGEEALPLIDSASFSADATLRAACARAYGATGSAAAVKRLTLLLNDTNPVVRYSALESLISLDSLDRPFHLRRGLSDADDRVRITALDAIGTHKLFSFLPDLEKLIDGWRARSIDMRRSTVTALGELLKEQSADSLAKNILTAAMTDEEYVIRREAAALFKEHLKEDFDSKVAPAQTRISVSRLEKRFTNPAGTPVARVTTNKGEISFELLLDVAPLTVLNFIELAKSGFYDKLTFHRIVPGFVVQGGDPRGDGSGGPEYLIRDEYSSEPYVRGSVGIATSGKDTGGSQFFFTLTPQPHLEARYTLFGQVIGGMDVVDRIAVGDTIRSITIEEPAE